MQANRYKRTARFNQIDALNVLVPTPSPDRMSTNGDDDAKVQRLPRNRLGVRGSPYQAMDWHAVMRLWICRHALPRCSGQSAWDKNPDVSKVLKSATGVAGKKVN